jgi:hypothetical protein
MEQDNRIAAYFALSGENSYGGAVWLQGGRRTTKNSTIDLDAVIEMAQRRARHCFKNEIEPQRLAIQFGTLARRRQAPGYLIFDRGTNFNQEVIDTVNSFGINPRRTSYRSPWQNGVAERWVGNCCRDFLDHVIVLNERHLKRLMSEYVRYYHDDRTHLELAKGTTDGKLGRSAPPVGLVAVNGVFVDVYTTPADRSCLQFR